jgi:hypothetical protein
VFVINMRSNTENVGHSWGVLTLMALAGICFHVTLGAQVAFAAPPYPEWGGVQRSTPDIQGDVTNASLQLGTTFEGLISYQTGGAIQLLDANGNVLDAVSWIGTEGSYPVLGSGTPLPQGALQPAFCSGAGVSPPTPPPTPTCLAAGTTCLQTDPTCQVSCCTSDPNCRCAPPNFTTSCVNRCCSGTYSQSVVGNSCAMGSVYGGCRYKPYCMFSMNVYTCN